MKWTEVLYYHLHPCSNVYLLHVYSMASVVEQLVDEQSISDDSSDDESSSVFEYEK